MKNQPDMIRRDWLVTETGNCEPRPSIRDWDLIRDRYYLHRFLTEVEDILNEVQDTSDEWDRLPQIRMRVRQLVNNSYWVRRQYLEPCPKTGVAILTLYDEIGYPLTVQTVTFAPGKWSSIHNHGTWGVVAVLKGEEKHTFWKRVNDPDFPNRIEQAGEKCVKPGSIISFVPDAIHQVEAIATEPTVTFHLYGDTQPRSRFEFDPKTHTAKPF
jgi:predicted metal-dependent enzyme (double-stranded beta helix superfamily)